VELDAAIERLTALAGELVDALVVSRGDGDRPLVQLSGAQLTVRTEPGGTLAAMSRPLIVGVGDNTLWLWPDRFVEANPLAAGAPSRSSPKTGSSSSARPAARGST